MLFNKNYYCFIVFSVLRIYFSDAAILQVKNETQANTNDNKTSMYDILSQIKEKLTILTNTSENILQKLYNVENRIFKVEFDIQEKTDKFYFNDQELSGKIQILAKELSAIKKSNAFSSLGAFSYEIATPNNDKKTKLEKFSPIILQNPQSSISQKRAFEIIERVLVNNRLPKDCSEILEIYGNTSGVYTIQPPHAKKPVEVFCDQETRGGGWTVIQNRFNGSVDFFRNWHDYKNGFGSVHGEHWLGLETVHLLTNFKINELHIDIKDFDNNKVFAEYDAFVIESESKNYRMAKLGTYIGTAGDGLKTGPKESFTTYDRDNDSNKDINCAKFYSGAWWHKSCFSSNLNGKYMYGGTVGSDSTSKGIVWETYKSHNYSHKASRMMIRPRLNQVYL